MTDYRWIDCIKLRVPVTIDFTFCVLKKKNLYDKFHWLHAMVQELPLHIEMNVEFDTVRKFMSCTGTCFQVAKLLQCYIFLQELHLHGNSIGNEGVRALMSGLSAHKGAPFTIKWLPTWSASFHLVLAICLLRFTCACWTLFWHGGCFVGKISLLDISNNEIGSKGAFHVAEFIKQSKSLLWLNLYMNDIGDEVWIKLLFCFYFYYQVTYPYAICYRRQIWIRGARPKADCWITRRFLDGPSFTRLCSHWITLIIGFGVNFGSIW